LSLTAVPPTVPPTADPSGPLVISQASAWPNPNPLAALVYLEGPADRVTLKVYTPAWVLVGLSENGPLAKGWGRVPMPSEVAQAPRGLYYFSVQAQQGDRRSLPRSGRFYLWR